jgi:hypothetical protein
MFRNLDPVLDTVTVLTPQLIDEGRVGIEPGALRGSVPHPVSGTRAGDVRV